MHWGSILLVGLAVCLPTQGAVRGARSRGTQACFGELESVGIPFVRPDYSRDPVVVSRDFYDLYGRAMDGNPAARNQFVLEAAGHMWPLLAERLDTNTAADALQNALVRLLAQRRVPPSPEAFLQYVRMAARNIALDILRQRARKVVVLETDIESVWKESPGDARPLKDVPSPELPPDDALMKQETAERMPALIAAFRASLTTRENDLYERRVVQGKDWTTVATETGLNIDTARVIFSRMLSRFRRNNEELLDTYR